MRNFPLPFLARLSAVLSLLLLSLVLFTFLNITNAFASTPYDNAVQLTPTATLVSPDGTKTRDISTTLMTVLSNSTASSCPVSYSNWTSSINSGNGAWGVSTFVNGGNQIGVYGYWNSNYSTFKFGFSSDASGNRVDFSGGASAITPSSSTAPGGSVILLLDNADNISVICSDNSYMLSSNTISSSGQFFLKILFSNAQINYPTGYAGPTVPSSFTTAQPLTKILPNITADINGFDVKLKSNLLPLLSNSNYKIHWYINNLTFDTPPSDFVQFGLDGTSPPDTYVNFTVPKKGKYNIQAQFVSSTGGDLAPIPLYEYQDSFVQINVDGSIFSVDTDKYTCNSTGTCTPTVIPDRVDELCDLTHLGGCVNNTLYYIGNSLGIVKTGANPTGSPFVAFSTDSHGLQSIITAPISAISSLINSTCIPINLPIPFVDRSIQLPCYTQIYQSKFGAVFTLYQTVVTGVISYYVIVGFLNLVKGFKDPKKDQIEVLSL